jgi:hypothetical protein
MSALFGAASHGLIDTVAPLCEGGRADAAGRIAVSFVALHEQRYDDAIADITDAEKTLSALQPGLAPFAALLRERAEFARTLFALGYKTSEPLPLDIQASSDPFSRVNACAEAMTRVARDIPATSPFRFIGRLYVAEALFVVRRADAALVTLTPLMEHADAGLHSAAYYLIGKIRYFAMDRAKARAAWQQSAKRPGSLYAQLAADAVDALSERHTPMLPDLFGKQ